MVWGKAVIITETGSENSYRQSRPAWPEALVLYFECRIFDGLRVINPFATHAPLRQ